jgi:ABC-type nitrate/sulfonate/bicarbonate transport system permease component
MSMENKFLNVIILIILIILGWEFLALAKIINVFILPPPHIILKEFVNLLSTKELFDHIINSLYRVGIGFGLSIIIGIPIGILIYECQILRDLFYPILSFIKPIPPIAWMPFSLLLFGIGNGPAFFLTFISSIGPLVFSTYWAFCDISDNHKDVGRCLNLNFKNRWLYIMIPGGMPKIFESIRIAFGLSWMAVIAAEMISAQNGLGHLITSAQDTLRSDIVIIGMFTIGLMGYLFDFFIKIISKKLIPWKIND